MMLVFFILRIDFKKVKRETLEHLPLRYKFLSVFHHFLYACLQDDVTYNCCYSWDFDWKIRVKRPFTTVLYSLSVFQLHWNAGAVKHTNIVFTQNERKCA